MFEDKDIHDIFEQANLNNEDWLEPSDKVLENIEKEIYRKKKRRWFWFLIPAFLVLLGAFMLSYYANLRYTSNQTISAKTPKTNNENTSKNKPLEVTENQKISNERSKAGNTKINKLIDKNDVDETQNIISLKEEKATLNTQSETQIKKNEKSIRKKDLNKTSLKNEANLNIDKNVNLNSNSKTFSTEISSTRKVDPTFQNKNKLKNKIPNIEKQTDNSIFEKSATHPILSSNIKSIVKKRTAVENRFRPTERLNLKQVFLSGNLLSTDLENSKNVNISDQNPSVKYQISTGFSWCKFILNEAYNKALKSADFIHNTGKGFFVSAEAQKAINPKITITGNLQYEQVIFRSGHNTNVTYSKDKEDAEMTNNFDIKIATPMGFSDSNIGIKRTTSTLNQPIDLLIDLENSHQVFNLDVGLNLSAQFVEFVKLSGAIVFGTGINQVLGVRNQLYSLETNNAQFEASGDTKLSTQSELNKTRPYVGAGLRLNYMFNSDQVLQLQYQFKQDLLPFYREDAFKSSLSRQQLGIGYLLRF